MRGSKAFRLALALSLLALAGAGLGLITSSASESAPSNARRGDLPGTESPTERPTTLERPAQNAGSASGSIPKSDRPRTRLPEGHTPGHGRPVAQVEIPSIGVDAPMIRLALNPDETLEVPADASETGWWSGGTFPGERGPAVVAGHVDSHAGPAVFFRLRELERGDEVRVTRPGRRTARFVVVGSEAAPKNDFPTRAVYGRTAEPTLRLVTCTGEFDEESGRYPDNLIVFARRVNPRPHRPASRPDPAARPPPG